MRVSDVLQLDRATYPSPLLRFRTTRDRPERDMTGRPVSSGIRTPALSFAFLVRLPPLPCLDADPLAAGVASAAFFMLPAGLAFEAG